MNTLMRNMVLMCFSAFVLHTAILAHADVGYFADNLQKIKEYIASDTLHYYINDYQDNVRSVVRQDGAVVESNEYYPTEHCSQQHPRHSPINTEQKSSTATTASTSMTPKPAGMTRCSVAPPQWTH